MKKDKNIGKKEKDLLQANVYFGSPIYWAEKPEWLKPLLKATDPYIKIAKEKSKKNIKERNKHWGGNKKDHGMVHHSTTLINMPGFETIQNWLIATSYNLLNEQGYDLRNYKIFMNELWTQEFGETGGGHHTLHTHYNGHMSGFYFLKCSEKTSLPIFDDPRPGALMNSLPEKDRTQVTLASSQIFYTVRPGTLLMFNSHLPHQFRVDDGYEPFRFIHFNCRAVEIDTILNQHIK